MTVFRYSGAGDQLISPVYIAPTLPPYVERTWPEDEVAFLEVHIIRFEFLLDLPLKDLNFFWIFLSNHNVIRTHYDSAGTFVEVRYVSQDKSSPWIGLCITFTFTLLHLCKSFASTLLLIVF